MCPEDAMKRIQGTAVYLGVIREELNGLDRGEMPIHEQFMGVSAPHVSVVMEIGIGHARTY